MRSAERIGVYLAGLFAAVVAYHKGYMQALAEVKSNNAKKQEEYAEIKKSVTGDTLGSVADKLQDGSERY